jgi:hypothetical protein
MSVNALLKAIKGMINYQEISMTVENVKIKTHPGNA